jgi:flagellar biosynthesis/type III secretory pathway M-ring protein FliF/YscJ
VIILFAMVRMTEHLATWTEIGYTVFVGLMVLFLIVRKQITRRRSAWRK